MEQNNDWPKKIPCRQCGEMLLPWESRHWKDRDKREDDICYRCFALALTPEEQARHLLCQHDWYYMMSDDHGVWAKGQAHMDRIYIALSVLPKEKANELWDEYAPNDFNRPFWGKRTIIVVNLARERAGLRKLE